MDSGPEGFAVLAAMLRLLAADDERRIDHALQVLADGLSVEATLTLREAGRSRTSAVIATSGLALVPAQARSANALLDIPLRQAGRLAAALCVVAAAPLDSEDLLLLGAAADVLTLTLASVLPAIDARRQVLEIEAERSDVAHALGEGPLPALVAALYVCESSSEESPATSHVRSALDELRRVEKTLVARSLAGDLGVSLRAAVAASRRTGAEVRLDLPSRLLPCSPVEAVTAYHVVLAALEGVRTQARVRVETPLRPTPDGFLTITVSGALEAHDTGTLARWARRAAALDGRLDRHLDGVTLVLPWSSARPNPDGSADEPVRDRSESLVAR
ncbi:hypothetical protein acdb102_07270 [Acidothermaceae bacterium B102]|nr:hypothetical protein acdb102_07270 [Acidothermaceae bacterium B102]